MFWYFWSADCDNWSQKYNSYWFCHQCRIFWHCVILCLHTYTGSGRCTHSPLNFFYEVNLIILGLLFVEYPCSHTISIENPFVAQCIHTKWLRLVILVNTPHNIRPSVNAYYQAISQHHGDLKLNQMPPLYDGSQHWMQLRWWSMYPWRLSCPCSWSMRNDSTSRGSDSFLFL